MDDLKLIECYKINISKNTTEKVTLQTTFILSKNKDMSGILLGGLSFYIFDKLPILRPIEQNKNWFLRDHFVFNI
jgi:hypothetical protein